MQIRIFWATKPLTLEPEIIDSADWKNLTRKNEPTNDSVLDDVKGWIHGISVWGRTHKADHVAVEENPSGHPRGSIKVTHWDDDIGDRPADEFHAKSFIYEPEQLKDGKWICQQFTEMWLGDKIKKLMDDAGEFPMFTQNHAVIVHKFSEFVKPDESLTLHGIWQTREDNLSMTEIDHPGYREFI